MTRGMREKVRESYPLAKEAKEIMDRVASNLGALGHVIMSFGIDRLPRELDDAIMNAQENIGDVCRMMRDYLPEEDEGGAK